MASRIPKDAVRWRGVWGGGSPAGNVMRAERAKFLEKGAGFGLADNLVQGVASRRAESSEATIANDSFE